MFFVHASGKDRMATLAKAMTELDVPVDVIADIDVLKSENTLKEIVETLGGDWNEIQPMVQRVRNDIEQHNPPLHAQVIKEDIHNALDDVELTGEFPKETQKKIEKIFRRASPWDAVKVAGEAAIPQGQATQQFRKLIESCKELGLWIVPVGELEGFCKSIGGHGPRWVQQVIETRNLSTDSDLQHARDFVREIWKSRSSE